MKWVPVMTSDKRGMREQCEALPNWFIYQMPRPSVAVVRQSGRTELITCRSGGGYGRIADYDVGACQLLVGTMIEHAESRVSEAAST